MVNQVIVYTCEVRELSTPMSSRCEASKWSGWGTEGSDQCHWGTLGDKADLRPTPGTPAAPLPAAFSWGLHDNPWGGSRDGRDPPWASRGSSPYPILKSSTSSACKLHSSNFYKRWELRVWIREDGWSVLWPCLIIPRTKSWGKHNCNNCPIRRALISLKRLVKQ